MVCFLNWTFLLIAAISIFSNGLFCTVLDNKSDEHTLAKRSVSGVSNETVNFMDPIKTAEILPARLGTDSSPINRNDQSSSSNLNIDFWHGLVASFSVIIVSELGDKTFFIAAILAMRHSRIAVFLGAAAALFLMTVLSVTLGWATQIIPRQVTYYVSTALFAIFGLKMLKEGYYMSPSEGQEEFEEAQEEVRKKEDEMARFEAESLLASTDLETGVSPSSTVSGGVQYKRQRSTMGLILRVVSKIFVEAFVLTFLAEWGDRSQLATIILASRENIVAVTVGGFAGHALCTGFAVLGGRMIAQRISVRTVTLIGGVVFIVFALTAFFIDPDESEAL